ncbi:hypothetical protein FOMG_16407 [Fusarium oxysporum f. sp. melonis 26406]|uniref:Nucleotide sugar dehydrogenase n=1 Tax=Fusarium oxysporum f. sp. melonis 26406 TaxID=1089452 RepID=W9Z6Z4_FUSOX|nr:hypothetical protein FOMG_16407 [Fusarium oxysporum f. sp. melonis 26406]
MVQVDSPSLRRGSNLTLGLSYEKRILEQPWLSHHYTLSNGIETPPSDISTPVLDKDLNWLLESAAASRLDIPSVISSSDAPTVAVLGVGYVGTHLVSAFASKYPVIGFDVSKSRVNSLRAAQLDEAADDLKDIEYTWEPTSLRRATHLLISVPTLLRPNRTVDTSFLCKALQTVEKHARPGATIVIESSVAVGMTRELLGPLAAQNGFFAGMSPERVDPGRTEPPVASIPKIISALEDLRPGSLDSIMRIYSSVFAAVVPVSSPEVAEMTKLYENCQRMICIAYANEMADACTAHGIDPYEVCRAAATKPFGYMNYTPGLGVGGHCIPVNPFYLLSNSKFPLLEQATKRMHERPQRIALGILDDLYAKRSSGELGQKPRVLAVGMGFKKGQSTLSHSPGLELLKTLYSIGEVDVTWADSHVLQEAIHSVPKLQNERWNSDDLATFDLILVAFLQPDMDEAVLHALPAHVEVKWLGMQRERS